VLVCLSLSIPALSVAQAPADARARALALFKESAAHYAEGRYSVAVALLEEAYSLHPEPKLLYNLGRAHEAAGEVKAALKAYETYLQSEPPSARTEEVSQRMDQLYRETAPWPEENGEGSTRDPPRATSQTVPQEPASAEEAPSRRTVPWILVGSGTGFLATALTVGILAGAQHRQAERESVQTEATQLQDGAERKALAANLMAGAGGALLIVGGAWLLFGGSEESGKQAARKANLAWSVRLGVSSLDCALKF